MTHEPVRRDRRRRRPRLASTGSPSSSPPPSRRSAPAWKEREDARQGHPALRSAPRSRRALGARARCVSASRATTDELPRAHASRAGRAAGSPATRSVLDRRARRPEIAVAAVAVSSPTRRRTLLVAAGPRRRARVEDLLDGDGRRSPARRRRRSTTRPSTRSPRRPSAALFVADEPPGARAGHGRAHGCCSPSGSAGPRAATWPSTCNCAASAATTSAAVSWRRSPR